VVAKRLYLTGGIGARHDGDAFGKNYELPNVTRTFLDVFPAKDPLMKLSFARRKPIPLMMIGLSRGCESKEAQPVLRERNGF
jgi:hypothetical protein